MQLTPVIAIHMSAALAAVALGPFAIWARYALARGNIRLHQPTMVGCYIGACLVAGAFTFLPGRFMHQWLMSVI